MVCKQLVLTSLASLGLLISLPAAHAQAPAATPTAPAASTTTGKEVTESGENVSLNFSAAEIDTVVRAIGKISGRNFILDPRVKGTINIITSRPVSRSAVYPILLSALRLQGYAAIENGQVVKIVPEADAKLHAVPSGAAGIPVTNGERIVTEVFQIKFESAAQLLQVVRPLIAPNNTVSVYAGNNSLIVTDYAENIARIRRIIESIDVPGGDSQIIPLQNASAVDLAPMITKLFSESGSSEPSQKVSIIADPRSNALLIRSDSRSRLQAVRSLITQLDQSGTMGNLRVVYLKNGDATRIAQTLRAIANSDTSQAAGQQRTAQNSSTASTQTAASFGSAVGGAYIYADTSSNSIVINASDALYNSLRATIEKLDRRPAQVYVEALIAEVSADRASEFGMQFNSAIGGKTSVFGGTNFSSGGSNLLSVASGTTASTGLNLAIGGGSVVIPGVGTIANISMLAHYLQTDNKTNILSTPNIVTVDNEEAKIVVGRNVPFVTGSYTTSTSTGVSNPFQTIERKDVGLTLKIKPQITEGGTVRLIISQEVSSVLSTSATLGPTTSKRSLDSTVILDDGAFLALGGLVEDSYSGSVEKVPVLGDLPVIGALFRYDTRTQSKTNLVIFLRPIILRSAEDAGRVTESRYDYILGKQKDSTDSKVVPPNLDEPRLPDVDPKLPSPQPAPAATTSGGDAAGAASK
jgi:general secretion pathway protein D